VLGGRGEGEVTVALVYAMKALREVEVQLHSFLTSTLDGIKIRKESSRCVVAVYYLMSEILHSKCKQYWIPYCKH